MMCIGVTEMSPMAGTAGSNVLVFSQKYKTYGRRRYMIDVVVPFRFIRLYNCRMSNLLRTSSA